MKEMTADKVEEIVKQVLDRSMKFRVNGMTYEEMWSFADRAVKGGLRSKSIKSQDQAFLIIAYGAELGMLPMVALKSITFKGQFPTLDGDPALGLVRASGKLLLLKEWVDGDTLNTWVAHCQIQRTGEDELTEFTFSVDEAKSACLWKISANGDPMDNYSPWGKFPKRMLRYRALGFALRDKFSDVLQGSHITEEIEDDPVIPPPPCETPKRADRKKVESIPIETPVEEEPPVVEEPKPLAEVEPPVEKPEETETPKEDLFDSQKLPAATKPAATEPAEETHPQVSKALFTGVYKKFCAKFEKPVPNSKTDFQEWAEEMLVFDEVSAVEVTPANLTVDHIATLDEALDKL